MEGEIKCKERGVRKRDETLRGRKYKGRREGKKEGRERRGCTRKKRGETEKGTQQGIFLERVGGRIRVMKGMGREREKWEVMALR